MIRTLIARMASWWRGRSADHRRPRTPTPDGEPDLALVGTRALFGELASRYDGCVAVCVRHAAGDDGKGSAAFLARGVENPAAFLRSSAALLDESEFRDIREGDL